MLVTLGIVTVVLPAQAGMIPSAASDTALKTGAPRAGGDDPALNSATS